MKMQYLSKKMVKEILKYLKKREEIDQLLIDFFKNADSVKLIDTQKYDIIVADSLPVLFRKKNSDFYVPTLFIVNYILNTRKSLILPAVVVDEGAVKPLTRGADVMIPGIRKVIKPFCKGSIVAVLEPKERYAIVIGIALVDSTTIIPGTKGKGIENLTYLNDDLWQLSLQIARGSTS